jgi:glycine/D-amino acid oxidase-like deaminating enzyme
VNPDVVVIGAGVMGVWTALELRRAGREVLLLDAYGFGHPRATSADQSRIMRASHGADRFHATWSREAREAWIALGEATGDPLFIQAGMLWFTRRADGFEAASEATLRSLGIPVEHLPPAEIEARWPGTRAGDLAFALFEPEGGVLRARAGIVAVAAAVEREGGRREIEGVAPPQGGGSRLGTIRTQSGRSIAAGAFVFAAGPWLPRLFPDVVGDRIRVTKQSVHYLGPAPGDTRWAAPRFPSWVDYDTSFYGLGAVDGGGVKVATDAYGGDWDPDGGERLVDPDALPPVRDYCRTRFPELADAPVVESRVCQYETTADSHFLIDRHPRYEDVWLVGGGSGHGYKHGPMIGRHVRRLLDGHVPEGEERRFLLDRAAAPPAGLRTVADAVSR